MVLHETAMHDAEVQFVFSRISDDFWILFVCHIKQLSHAVFSFLYINIYIKKSTVVMSFSTKME